MCGASLVALKRAKEQFTSAELFPTQPSHVNEEHWLLSAGYWSFSARNPWKIQLAFLLLARVQKLIQPMGVCNWRGSGDKDVAWEELQLSSPFLVRTSMLISLSLPLCLSQAVVFCEAASVAAWPEWLCRCHLMPSTKKSWAGVNTVVAQNL